MSEQVLNHFTHKLYNKLGSKNHENFFISPFSISTALAMCYFGAKDETARQLRDLLHLSNLTDSEILELNNKYITNINNNLSSDVTISSANKIYPGMPVEQSYIDLVAKHFASEVQNIDYSNAHLAADTINEWVSAKTNKKITNLLSPSDFTPLTRMVLVNAIYFKGNWVNKFKSEMTEKKDFHSIDGQIRKVDMMHLYGKKFVYSSRSEIHADTCTFPYIGNKVVMTVILPQQGHTLDQVESKLNATLLDDLLSQPMPALNVNVQLPKFKLEHKTELNEHFKQMGALLPFDEAKADFSRMRDGLFISKVVHKAVVEVNEEGTEAAAATAAVMNLRCARPRPVEPPKEFICDRPFMFIIHERIYNTTIFIGKYVKPQ